MLFSVQGMATVPLAGLDSLAWSNRLVLVFSAPQESGMYQSRLQQALHDIEDRLRAPVEFTSLYIIQILDPLL